MKIIHSDFKKGEIKVKIESLDDLWYLSTVIDKDDLVKGETVRKIKLGEDERKSKIIKKRVFLKIKVEKIEFSKYTNILRVSGIIVEGPEDVPRGSYHTFNLEEGTTIKIIKEQWLNFQIKKIKEASAEKPPKVLICVIDREEAHFALLKKFGYELLSSLKGKVAKKSEVTALITNFYVEIIKLIQDYDKKYNLNSIIIASPAFWKEDLMKNLKDEDLKKKITLATCSSCDESAINEILKRQETQNVLKQDKISKEINLVEELLKEISKNNLSVYGFKEVKERANAGAIKILLVSDEYILKTREVDKYEEVEKIMKAVEATQGEIKIISSEHDGGKKLDGLGGIAGILRYKSYE